MGEPATRNYLNPLTLEAQIFLNSMEKYGKSCNKLDKNLYQTLKNVVVAIEKFLGQNLSPTVATENTKLVDRRELNTIIRIYHCGVCKIDLGKRAEKATVHLANGHKIKTRKSVEKNDSGKRQRKNNKEKQANVNRRLPKKITEIFAMEMPKFFTASIILGEKLKHIREYDIIENELLDLIKPLFAGQSIKVYKFGSRIAGVGTHNSDLDMFIDIGKTFNNFENKASALTKKNLKAVHDVLKKNQKSWLHLRAIESARVPILKVLNATTGIACDIGFSNSLGYCNTKLMAYFFVLQPIARRMCFFLKKWLERSKLNEHITTYTISLMVIYFLQIQRKMPPIELLQFGLDKKVNVGPWIANFVEKTSDIEKTRIALNIERLDSMSDACEEQLIQYFEFYSTFNFEKFVVCPYFGRLIQINQIEVLMPQRYATYVQTADEGKDRALQLNKPMIVQDPIQLNHNVSKAVTPNILKNIRYYFEQSAIEFKKQIYPW